MGSILGDTKKVLSIDPDYKAFDLDIMMHINTVFTTLQQLGIGPDDGFMIEDDATTWDAFLGNDPKLNPVKTYVYLRVRQIFDPPQTSFHVEAMKEQIKEIEWRLNVHRESTQWVSPKPLPDTDEVVLDGGAP